MNPHLGIGIVIMIDFLPPAHLAVCGSMLPASGCQILFKTEAAVSQVTGTALLIIMVPILLVVFCELATCAFLSVLGPFAKQPREDGAFGIVFKSNSKNALKEYFKNSLKTFSYKNVTSSAPGLWVTLTEEER